MKLKVGETVASCCRGGLSPAHLMANNCIDNGTVDGGAIRIHQSSH